jgi:predicted flavoprotein YhiN
MSSRRIVIAGGGAAGFFAAITAAEAGADVTLLEKTARFLDKVRISGGGRCNVTHACFDPREFAAHYPRGGQALLGPFHQFSALDTVAWFESRGVQLKTEADGRMFPTTDSSQTIVDCLMQAAQQAGVKLRLNCAVESVVKRPDQRFELRVRTLEKLSLRSPSDPVVRPAARPPPPGELRAGNDPVRGRFLKSASHSSPLLCGKEANSVASESITCDCLLLATGGCRAEVAGALAVSLGHALEPPVPSLFTFQIESPWLRALAGVSLDDVEVSVPSEKLRERGPLLMTHQGVSGPAVLRLSAWGARNLHDLDYHFQLRVNWLPALSAEEIAREFKVRRETSGMKRVVNMPIAPVPSRLWERLVQTSGVPREIQWSSLTRSQVPALTRRLTHCELQVSGKSLNQDEFVTCGGVRLAEVNFKTMQSRKCPGLYFAGELLDLDGLTGGFNFQAAWTTGFIAGDAMAQPPD